MKDKFIQQKLNQYVEAVKPEQTVIAAAVFELRQKRCQNESHAAAPSRRRALYYKIGAISAAWILLISLVVYFMQFQKPNPGTPLAYNLSQLTYQTASIEEIQSSSLVLTLKPENSYTNARLYFAKNIDEPVMISVLYRTLGEGGLDEIIVIADLKNGLENYNDFKKHSKTDIGGVTVHLRQILQNGEYYTEAYFNFDGISYYIKVASPLFDGARGYISLLIGG